MQKTWRPALVVALSLIGAVISAYLTAMHLRFLSTGQPSLCNLGETLNCDVVNTSPWSEVLGVPISHLGTLFYVGCLGLGIVALLREPARARLQPYLLLGSLFAVGLSLFLAFVSLQLRAACVFCASLYAVNLTLLLTVAAGAGPLRALAALPGQLADDVRFVLRPQVVLVLSLGLAAGVASTYQIVLAGSTAHQAAAGRKGPESVAQKGAEPPARVDLTDPAAPTLGPADAPVTLVEVSDFECPFCQRASETVAELRKRYGAKLRVVFRNFPLDQACNGLLKRQIHENACAAARAALCAGEQGKFWPYAERLWGGATEPADLPAHAKALGLSEPAFTSCQSAPSTNARITADIAACSKAGVTAVPVFFINGRKLAGAQPIEAFQAIIDEELADAAHPAAPPARP